MKTLCIFFTLILYASTSLGQSTLIEQSSPNAAAAQLFFFDRTSHNTTDRNWKIATLPASSNSSGDKLLIELFGGSHGSSSTFQQIIHMGNRGGFNGYLRATYGNPYQSVRIRAFAQPDGSIDIFLSLLANGWKGASVRIYEGSGIVTVRPVIYETPVDVGPSPSGSPVFDSYDEIPGLVLRNDGNIGIGTKTLDEKLTIQGDVNVGGDANGTIKTRHINGKSHTSTAYGNLYLNYHTDHPVIVGTTTNQANLYLYGKMGIGTTSPDPNAELTVAGNVHSREVKVTVDAGADFVFEENYDLKPLQEVEHYIKTNKHLSEIPSEKQMLQDGLHLGEMNIKLLQKIEELTLYTIAQEKLLNTQAEQLNKQKQSFEEQLSQQEKLIEKLIKRIETLEKQ